MRILLTGGSGYLGVPTVRALRDRGHEVVTIGRHPGVDAFVCDLQQADAVREAVHSAGVIDAVVHLAARAHGFRGMSAVELSEANVSTTRHLVDALRAEGRATCARFVHASSVAVYDVLDAVRGVPAAEAPYAASKHAAEGVVVAAAFRGTCLLRFAPVFDPSHLQDVAKRVFLPGTRVKLRLVPPPLHRLCTLERAVKSIVDAAEDVRAEGVVVADVAEPRPFSQHELVGWFPGTAVPFPVAFLRAVAGSLMVCGPTGRKIAHGIAKFI